MSDVMLYGVLRMPYEMAMDGEIARRQFYQRAQEAADRVEKAERLYAAVEKLIKAKGRFHAEQNYKALVEAFAAIEAERAALDEQRKHLS